MPTPVTRLAVEDIASWPLRGPSDLFEALTELEADGWEGAVTREGGTWSLRLSASGKQTVNATVGQWIVDDGGLKVLSPQEFIARYAPAVEVDFPTVDEVEEPEPEEIIPQTSPDTSVPISRIVR
jgi:hypothetical protein